MPSPKRVRCNVQAPPLPLSCMPRPEPVIETHATLAASYQLGDPSPYPSLTSLSPLCSSILRNRSSEAPDNYSPEPTGSDFEEAEEATIANTGLAKTSNKRQQSHSHKRNRPLRDNSDSDDEIRLTLRKGSFDQTPDNDLLTYKVTWLCKLAGKKVAEDTVRDVKDFLAYFWKEQLYRQREQRLQQNGVTKNRRFRVGRATVRSPGRSGSLTFTIDNDSPTSGIQWEETDKHLVEYGNQHSTREIIVKIEWEFDEIGVSIGEQQIIGASASANLFREAVREMQSERGEACQTFAQGYTIYKQMSTVRNMDDLVTVEVATCTL
jgi:hypothetical protein